MSRVHVLPTNDVTLHEVSEDCVCGPDTEFVSGGAVIVHHSLDSREEGESTNDYQRHAL